MPTTTKGIQAWTIKTCPSCRRTRTHYRIGTQWRCIGKLSGRRSQSCGEKESQL